VKGVDFIFNPHNRTFALCYDCMPSAETIEHWLTDLILPQLLAYDGHFVLHCGIVNTAKGALGFMGPSGHGKSTMTASLHHSGLTLMSDDAVLLRNEDHCFHVERLYPSLRLFPDSLDELFPTIEATAPVADYTDKRHVAFAPGPVRAPLIALFRLAEPAEDIRILRLAPAEACMALIANSFALDAANPAESKRRFVKAADVARQVPVYDLHYPRIYTAIPDVHAQIFAAVALANPKENTA